MKQDYYLIKDAAAKVGVESHVLRYWEEELKMEIRRNEMGHRYYTEKDIEVFTKVRDLKERGLQLKAIRSYLDKRRSEIGQGVRNNQKDPVAEMAEESKAELVVTRTAPLSDDEKMAQFQQIMNRILSNAIQENNELIGKTAGEHAANVVVQQIGGMTKEQEERAEERYRKLDQTLREIQLARAEAAAANMRPVDRRKQKRLKKKSTQSKVVEMPIEPVKNDETMSEQEKPVEV